MVDYGLFISMAVSVAALWLATKIWTSHELRDRSPIDQLTAPLLGGLIAGRVVTLAFSDLAGLTNIREFMTFRGGVEFWPAVAVGMFILVVLFSRPDDPSQDQRAVALLPFAIVLLGSFQATCVFRDGCPGPQSSIGFVPSGLSSTQLPIGLIAGLTLIGFAVWLRRSALPSHTKILIAVFGVGAERSLAGAIEPNLSSALSRDGLAMTAAFAATITWWFWFEHRERQWRWRGPPSAVPS